MARRKVIGVLYFQTLGKQRARKKEKMKIYMSGALIRLLIVEAKHVVGQPAQLLAQSEKKLLPTRTTHFTIDTVIKQHILTR